MSFFKREEEEEDALLLKTSLEAHIYNRQKKECLYREYREIWVSYGSKVRPSSSSFSRSRSFAEKKTLNNYDTATTNRTGSVIPKGSKKFESIFSPGEFF